MPGLKFWMMIKIILNVPAIEKEIDDDVEKSVLYLKPKTSLSEAKAMLTKCTDWFEVPTRGGKCNTCLTFT